MLATLASFASGAHLTSLIMSLGYVGVAAIIFCESGLLFGFFFPGDSLLFTAGVLATQDYFSLPILIAVVTVAAIAGDSVGYAIGSYSGVHLFTRPDSILFKKRYVEETHSYFTKYGPYTVIIARFIPVVRTFAPVMAGVGKMKYSTFLIYNCIGGALWAAGITVAGFWLGNTIPNIDKYLLPVIGLIIIVSIIPPTVQWFRHKKPLTHDPQ